MDKAEPARETGSVLRQAVRELPTPLPASGRGGPGPGLEGRFIPPAALRRAGPWSSSSSSNPAQDRTYSKTGCGLLALSWLPPRGTAAGPGTGSVSECHTVLRALALSPEPELTR